MSIWLDEQCVSYDWRNRIRAFSREDFPSFCETIFRMGEHVSDSSKCDNVLLGTVQKNYFLAFFFRKWRQSGFPRHLRLPVPEIRQRLNCMLEGNLTHLARMEFELFARDVEHHRVRRIKEFCTAASWNRAEVKNTILSYPISIRPEKNSSASYIAEWVTKYLEDRSAEECQISQISFSLRDPLTRKRIDVAVRSLSCAHMQPFDLDTFLAYYERSQALQTEHQNTHCACPVCNKVILLTDVHHEPILDFLIEDLHEDGDFVLVNKNGYFSISGLTATYNIDKVECENKENGNAQANLATATASSHIISCHNPGLQDIEENDEKCLEKEPSEIACIQEEMSLSQANVIQAYSQHAIKTNANLLDHTYLDVSTKDHEVESIAKKHVDELEHSELSPIKTAESVGCGRKRPRK